MTHDETSDSALTDLAKNAGIAVQWRDARGNEQRVTPDVLRTVLSALGLPADDAAALEISASTLKRQRDEETPGLTVSDLGQAIDLHGIEPGAYELIGEDGMRIAGTATVGAHGTARLDPVDTPGYYRVLIGEHDVALAVAPSRSPSVADLSDAGNARAWGVSAQVYSLRRSAQDPTGATGFGDFAALAELARGAAGQGAQAIAISPVHAMFSADPARYSPYGPSSRLFLNALFADPAGLLGTAAVSETIDALGLAPELARLDALPRIDWPKAARTRLALMRGLYDRFRQHAHSPLHVAFADFRRSGGEAIESHARFEALHAQHLPPLGSATDWRQWPTELRDPASAAVKHYAQAHEKDVGFHIFLQWLAADGMGSAQAAAKDSGMSIGLIADLAVGTDPGGSHAWSRQGDILPGLSPGAPPDIYNPLGQSWGITAFSPTALRAHGYAAFIEMLRAVLAQAGGIRIDHVLGLARMWLVPTGAAPKDGAYLHYPLDDMLRLIALEAWRHRALVVGENLGTVPEGFNQRIYQAGMLGMNVLWFEREAAAYGQTPGFAAPRCWTPHGLATTGTHDLPTVCGWWSARDIDWRTRLQLLAEHDTETAQRAERERDRHALWQALRDSGNASADAPPPPGEPPLDAVLAHVASAPSPLMLVPLEDMLGMTEQPNIPGTIDTHPNWVQRLDQSADAIFENSDVRRRCAAIGQARSVP